MTVASIPSSVFRPPKPVPHEGPIGVLRMIMTLRRNPLEVWSRAHYEQPILIGHSVLGERAVVSEPAAVRRIFLDNAANYRKDALQLRVLGPGLGKACSPSTARNGALSAARSRHCSRRARSSASRRRCIASPPPRPSGWRPGARAASSTSRQKWRA